MSTQTPQSYPLELVQRHFDRAASSYDSHAVIQREIGQRLLDHLDGVKLHPAVVLDAGCGTGLCTRVLAKLYPQARVVGLDLSPAMLARASRQGGWVKRLFGTPLPRVCADAQSLPLADGSVDLVFSNLTLQWCDLDLAFAEFVRVLRPGGLLLFSSFGPDTLHELRRAWQAVDDREHVHRFIDMHDVGDALMRAGLAEPVLDVDRIVMEYSEVAGVMRDLKGIGAQNLASDRPRGLVGKQQFARFRQAYEALAGGGPIPATYEVVFGHAWAGQSGRPGEFRIPADQIGSRW